MQRDVPQQAQNRWMVQSSEAVNQGWGCAKTGCLGIIFLPLALLGRRKPLHKVVYVREAL